jgi:D-sedoheptulose 7-phosphate isomerase
MSTPPTSRVAAAFEEALATHRAVLDSPLASQLEEAAAACVRALRAGGCIYWVGNGGSAADAQHLAAELVGRFHYDRPPLRSHALTVNTSALTALVNDYPPELIFARQARAFCGPQDVLVAISTSGNSPNILAAVDAAREQGCFTVGFTGAGGGKLMERAELTLRAPSRNTPRIQEVHILLGHTLCELVEAELHPRA